MKFQKYMDKKKFKIVITVGDESGIRPEIILKALSSKELSREYSLAKKEPAI